MKLIEVAVKIDIIDISEPELTRVKAIAAHVQAATGEKPRVSLWGVFTHKGEEVFADSSPIQPLGYDAKGRVKAKVDGVVIRLTIVRLERATVNL